MKNIWKILKISKPMHGLIIGLSSLILLGVILELFAPLLSKYIVDEIVAKVQGKGGNVERLVILIAFSFLASILSAIVTSISNRLGDHLAGRMRKFLTEKYYHKVLTLPQSHFDSELSGRMLNQLNRGIQNIYLFLNTFTNFFFPSLLQSVFTIAAMVYYNIYVGFFIFLLFPVYFFLTRRSTERWGMEEVKKNKIEDTIRGRIQEVISNIKLVKSFNTERQEYNIVSENLTASNKIYAVQSQTYHIFDFLRNGSLVIVLTIVNIFIFYDTFMGRMTIGEMVLIMQLVNLARRPLFAMSFLLTRIQEADSGSKEYFEVLDLLSTENFEKKHDYKFIENASIEFKDVSFKYDQSELVLKGVSFKIRPKEKVALVGHSGVGKTTIINLILKYYEPTGGELFLKDKQYKELDHGHIRHNISLVFQENELFSSTIRENVMYGSKASQEQIIEALKLANAYDFVKKLPKGLDSEVGERGVKLSGGQKQRIQIARAILKNAPILILDEATSSLDAKSEKEVQEALENLMRDKLVIIIAHRFSTIQNVNKIIVIEEGKVAAYGTPQELSTQPGTYKDLLNYQIEGNKKLLEQFEIY